MKVKIASAVIAALLSACGGNSDTPPKPVTVTPPVNQAPVADAGVDITADEQTSITLSGKATDNDGTIASYGWTQISGTSVTLSNSDLAQASFTAPDINANETLTFSLTVTDDDGAKHSDEVSVNVKYVNTLPVANAGADITADEKTSVTLTGEATDADGTIASYAWAQISGSEVTLNNSDQAQASFTAPEVNDNEALTFSLTVTDNMGAQHSDEVVVNVNHINLDPVANAGADITLDEESSFTIKGSGSDEDGQVTSYLWKQTQGTELTLSGIDTPELTLTFPSFEQDESFEFELTVTDNEGATHTDAITVTAKDLTWQFDSVKMRDLDGDHLLDLLVTHSSNGKSTKLLWQQNSPQDTFSAPKELAQFSNVELRKVEVKDMNLDGKPDLLVSYETLRDYTKVAWFRGLPNGGFSPEILIVDYPNPKYSQGEWTFPDGAYRDYEFGNIDNKNGDDIILVSETSIDWLQQQPDGSFATAQSLTASWNINSDGDNKNDLLPTYFYELEDYNGDGFADLTFYSSFGSTTFYTLTLNNKDNSFRPPRYLNSDSYDDPNGSEYTNTGFSISEDSNGDNIPDVYTYTDHQDDLFDYRSTRLYWHKIEDYEISTVRVIYEASYEYYYQRIAYIDWDEDGKKDYLMELSDRNNRNTHYKLVLALENDKFSAPQPVDIATWPNFRSYDLNQDGMNDFINDDRVNDKLYWQQKRLNGLAEPELLLEYKGTRLSGVFDINNDGHIDFYSIDDNTLYWYKNNGSLGIEEFNWFTELKVSLPEVK